MTIPSSVLAKMAVLGFTAEQAEAVATMLSSVETATREEGEPGKEKARARWRKWKDAQSPANASKRLQTTANDSKQLVSGDAPVEGNLLSQKIEPQESKKQDAQARDLADFKSELSDLDPERIAALVKHRRSKRGQNSGLAARLFRRDAEACGLSLAEAADTCISRNWITVKPEYFNQPRGSPKAPSQADVFKLIGQRAADDHRRETATDSGSARSLIPDLSIVRAG